MAWVAGEVKGFNLRNSNTAGWANIDTTPPNTMLLTVDTYPQTRNDVTFGKSAETGNGWSTFDADSTVNEKFAGRWYESPGNTVTIRVDLPASGIYKFRMANGSTDNATFVSSRQIITVKDGSTTLATMDSGSGSTGPAQDHYYDATGVDRTEAAWAGSNVGRDLTFSGTVCNIVIGDAGAGYTVLAHFSLERLASGPAAPTISAMSPASLYANPLANDVVIEDCTLTGTGFDVDLTGGDATVTSSHIYYVPEAVVITSATVITFNLRLLAGAGGGIKTLTVTTDNGAVGKDFTSLDPGSSGGGSTMRGGFIN